MKAVAGVFMNPELATHFPQVATAISAPTAWLGSRIQEGLWRDAEEGEELTL
jgi:hypothetical protein